MLSGTRAIVWGETGAAYIRETWIIDPSQGWVGDLLAWVVPP